MIITLTGENTFAIAAAERQLITAFASKYSANGIERVDAEALDANRLPDLLQGATLFAPARLVILKNVSLNKLLQEPLAEALATASDDTTVVVSESNLDKRTKLYKFLKAKSNFQHFEQLGEAQLVGWVQTIAKSVGGEIDKKTAHYLVRRVGPDQWRLQQEAEKLVHYTSPVTSETVDILVEPSPEGTAFELLDAALSGQSDRTAELLAALKTEEDPYKLFGLLASQVHALAVVAAAGQRSADQVAKEAGLHPFVVRKTQATVKSLGPARVKEIAIIVADCDWHLKSTGVEPWQLLGVALQKIASYK